MKHDVLEWACGRKSGKIISKETLNHPGLVELVSGLDVYHHTQQAYLRAYRALGIDLMNRVPSENAPNPTPAGESKPAPDKAYSYASLGIYDTAVRQSYACSTVDELWKLDVQKLQYEDLIVPVPHPCKAGDIALREHIIGNVGLYYPMLYTTLFMWPVMFLGWEIFMLAAITEPEKFHEHFLVPCAAKSVQIVHEVTRASNSPFVFLHDDLADAKGPIFPPSWYDDYILPHYREIFAPAKKSGKKIIFVADGNMTRFLPKLIELGIDGIMFENPATRLETVIEFFGRAGRFFIGGIDTAVLTNGSAQEIKDMVYSVADKCSGYCGFCMAGCGGLHGGIALDNLEAYFDARAEIGATPRGWRTICHI